MGVMGWLHTGWGEHPESKTRKPRQVEDWDALLRGAEKHRWRFRSTLQADVTSGVGLAEVICQKRALLAQLCYSVLLQLSRLYLESCSCARTYIKMIHFINYIETMRLYT